MTHGMPPSAEGLRLCRISGEILILCERIIFSGGLNAVDTILRRAQISGRVEIGGKIDNHFADILDGNGDMVETVALDKKSYGALKNRWMRCRVEY
jgi:hypothetical protein